MDLSQLTRADCFRRQSFETYKSTGDRSGGGSDSVRIKAIKFLDSEDGATRRLDEMRKEIVAEAIQTDVRHLPDYAPIGG